LCGEGIGGVEGVRLVGRGLGIRIIGLEGDGYIVKI
jgi:hypothetical protein